MSEYIPDFLTDYVSCITRLHPYGWARHTNERVFYASILSLYYSGFNRLRHFSMQLAERYRISYRRLEYYSEDIGVVDTRNVRGYGKLIQVVFYTSHETPMAKAYTIEGRVFIPAPLFVDIVLLYANSEFMEFIHQLLDDVLDVLGFLSFTEHDYYEVDGIFEDKSGYDTWCNGVTKVDLRDRIEVEVTKIEKRGVMRSYEYKTKLTIFDSHEYYTPLYLIYLKVHGIEPLVV